MTAGAGLILERRITRALGRRLVALVLFVMPCEPRPDLLETGVDRVGAAVIARGGEDLPDDAAVAVALVPDDPRALLEDDRGKVLLGALAVGLAALRRIDSG
jgi:hypothetical protein